MKLVSSNFEEVGSILVSPCPSACVCVCVCACVRACVRPCVRACFRPLKNLASVLKFHIWVPHQKLADPYFCPNYLSLCCEIPLFKGSECKFVSKISRNY